MAGAECRVCLEGTLPNEQLISPCACRGSTAFIHESCLERVCESKGNFRTCGLCNQHYIGKTALALAHAEFNLVDHRAEGDPNRLRAMRRVGIELRIVGQYHESIDVLTDVVALRGKYIGSVRVQRCFYS